MFMRVLTGLTGPAPEGGSRRLQDIQTSCALLRTIVGARKKAHRSGTCIADFQVNGGLANSGLLEAGRLDGANGRDWAKKPALSP